MISILNSDYFTDFTESSSSDVALQGKVSGSFGYGFVKGKFNAKFKSNKKFESKKHIVSATMRIERYYSSVKEEESSLSRDANQLLRNKDYVGFFKACGPNYVRSIRRAQEVTAVFSFESQSNELAKEFAAKLKVRGWGWKVNASFQSESKFKSMSESLEISIVGYGLGLNEQGSSTLVATSMDQFDEVMTFAFESMTQSENSAHIGMVYGIELVPWVDNTAFQVAAEIDTESVYFPMPRSSIPRALKKKGATRTVNFKDFDSRKEHRCKDNGYQIDKFGYCCSTEFMEDDGLDDAGQDQTIKDAKQDVITKQDALDGLPGDATTDARETAENELDTAKAKASSLEYTVQICMPRRALEPSIKKNNMSNNGEFVALIDSLVRYRLNVLFTLEKCITAVNSLPERFDYYILKSQDTVKYDATIEATYTVAELRLALDPMGDYSLVNHMGQELDEFIAMFYTPCLDELFGINIGTNSDTDPKFFMAESWYNHKSCAKLSCLADNMRWDRATGKGCVASVITGSTAQTTYGDNTTQDHCTKEIVDGEEKCKNPNKGSDGGEGLEDFREKAQACWDASARVKSPMYIMDHFCLPQITDDMVDAVTQKKIEQDVLQCKNPNDETSVETA